MRNASDRGSALLVMIVGLAVACGCTSAPVATVAGSPVGPSAAPPSRPAAVATVRPTSTARPSPGRSLLPSTTVRATEAPDGSIKIVMFGPPPKFRPDALRVPAGDVVIYLQNDSPGGDPHGTHGLAIGRNRDHPIAVSDSVPAARRAVFTVHDLPPGEYVMWCTFLDHASLGQIGTLTVE